MKDLNGKISSAFIHLFKNSTGHYLYDVNRNEIISIPMEIYELIRDIRKGKKTIANTENAEFLDNLMKQGYMKSNRVEISEHPITNLYEDYVENKISHLTLQVTQKCNFRCDYCVYGGGYVNRGHSNKRMSWDVAKRSMDFIANHSKDSKRIALSFYGGEPLIEFEFIQRCVTYFRNKIEGKPLTFNFTTNGTLLTEDKIEFLEKYDFKILISLDGPAHIHNKQRKYANGKGSYSDIINNLCVIKEKYPRFYKNNISFNTVLNPINGFEEINTFTKNNPIIKNQRFSSSLISSSYSKEEREYSKEFIEEYNYQKFLEFLSLIGRIKKENISKLLTGDYGRMAVIASILDKNKMDQLPKKFHRSGPCIPGISRLFVTTDGVLFPCERVSESTKYTKLGDVYTGINMQRAKEILNVEQNTSEQCRNCWAYLFCGNCITILDSDESLLISKMAETCRITRNNIENKLSDYVILNELGYDYHYDN